jgi:MerR family transcriptional regulator, thiopeptide resistance regulator
MYTISQLCSKVGLSRSTLLYYDAIGLLHPSIRTEKKYRYYSEQDFQRLQRICSYRAMGIPLEEIHRLLESSADTEQILEKHLGDLKQSMVTIKTQQQRVIQLLASDNPLEQEAISTKTSFVEVLHKAGLDEENLKNLHFEFEKLFPDQHQAFLEFLDLLPAEIVQIRANSKNGN